MGCFLIHHDPIITFINLSSSWVNTECCLIFFACGPVGAMGLAKRAFSKSMNASLEEALDYEAHLQEVARPGGEFSEG